MKTPKAKPSAFEKRVKRRISGREHRFFAVCPPGLGRICRKELNDLSGRLAPILPGAPQIREITSVPGGVEFTTRLPVACLANVFLGTPTRILMRVTSFKADSFSRLEKQMNGIDWELYLPGDSDPDIRVTCRKSRLYHSDAVEERCRPIIAAHLRNLPDRGQPDPDQNSLPRQTLMVRADQDWFEISLDMAGLPLFKRGIKQRVIQAPLRENLAFAMLKNLKFSMDDILVDPMCGSGTFSLEGAMMQAAVPPGFFRQFAFEAWPGFSARGFAHAKGKIRERITSPDLTRIFASDLDSSAIENLNIARNIHEIFGRISMECMDFFDLTPPGIKKGKGVVVLNPPYGKRLGKGMDMKRFFREIGSKLSKDFRGWHAGIICPDKALARSLNLPLQPMPIFHGGLDIHAAMGRIN